MSDMSAYEPIHDLPRVNFCEEGLFYVPWVSYGRKHPRQHMSFIYKDGCENMPVVMWIHGGAWDDEYLTSDYRHDPTIAELAKKGYFVVCVEYRLARHDPYPACVEDCELAVQYLKEHEKKLHIDANRIGLWGESAGSHIACMMGSRIRKETEGIKSIVAFYCPSDLEEQIRFMGELGFVCNVLPGGELTGEEKMEWLRKESPLTYADKKNLPAMLLVHGKADAVVNCEQSKIYAEKLQKAGNEVELVFVPDQGHGFFQGQEWYDRTVAFFEKTLK